MHPRLRMSPIRQNVKASGMANVLAGVIPRPNAPVEIRELSEPVLEPDSALLAVELSEVCGTDVYLQRGLLNDTPFPFIPGHVTVGRLEKIRGRLNDIDGRAFREGERVTFLDVHRTCHACYYCLVAKATTRCPHRKVYGITYGLSDGLTGGWAQKLYIKPGTRCIPLGDANAETFMAGGCGLPTALHAVERGQVSLGDTVLVLGSGPVGLSAMILALMSGALQVLCIGAPDDRLATARAMGANDVLNFQSATETNRLAWMRERTGGRGADVTIEATGAPSAVVEAMRYTRDNGRVVVVGQYTDHGETSFNPHGDLNKKHLDVRGCWGSDSSHFERGARIINDPVRGRPWSLMRLNRYGLNQANDALAAVAEGKVIKALIDPAR